MYLSDRKAREALEQVRTKYLAHEAGNADEWNTFVQGIATLAKELCDSKMDALRLVVGTGDEFGSLKTVRDECAGMSKGHLVAWQLYDELCQEDSV